MFLPFFGIEEPYYGSGTALPEIKPIDHQSFTFRGKMGGEPKFIAHVIEINIWPSKNSMYYV